MPRKWFLIIIIAIALVIIVISSGLYITSLPSFCKTCHVMNYFYLSWSNSTHFNNADCLDCHADPGLIGEIKAHISGLRYLYDSIFKNPDPKYIRTDVPNNRCLECHPLEELSQNTSKFPPKHKIHLVKESLKCNQCHDDLVHGTIRGRPVKPPEAFCKECHPKGIP